MPDNEVQLALDGSISCLRMAAKFLEDAGMPNAALHMRLQAEKNQAILTKQTTFARHTS